MHTCLYAFIHTYLHTYIHSWIHKPSKKFQLWCLNPGLANMLYRSDISDWRFIFPGPFALAFGIFYQICHWKSCGSQATLCYMCDFWSWHFLAHKRKVRRLTPPERADNLNSFTPKSPEVCGKVSQQMLKHDLFLALGSRRMSRDHVWLRLAFCALFAFQNIRYDSESICSMSSQIRCKHVNKLYIGIDFPK